MINENEIVAFNLDPFIPQIILNLKDKFGIKSAIETGTHKAGTTRWLSKNFERVYTVELMEEYFNISMEVLKGYTNTVLQLGDSVEWVERFLAETERTPLIFFDAHWYKNPLRGELEAVELSGRKPVIVIHDFYNPNHPNYQYDKYMEQGVIYNWDYIKENVERIYGKGGYDIMYNNEAGELKIGCIFIMPKG
jgi:hypothetical protein